MIEDQADELKDLKDTIDDQNDTIDDLKMKLEDLSDKFTELSEDENKVKESNLLHGQMIESLKRDNDKIFQKLSDNDSKFDKELIHQKVLYVLLSRFDYQRRSSYVQETLEDAVSDLMKDLAKLRVEQADTRQRGEQAQEEVSTSTVCISLFLHIYLSIKDVNKLNLAIGIRGPFSNISILLTSLITSLKSLRLRKLLD